MSNLPLGCRVVCGSGSSSGYYSSFPYSKRMMLNMGYKTLANELVDIGFTQIYVSRLEDLKTGFFKRENAVSDVVIDGIETIRSGMMLEYDRKISIQYHAFPGR